MIFCLEFISIVSTDFYTLGNAGYINGEYIVAEMSLTPTFNKAQRFSDIFCRKTYNYKE